MTDERREKALRFFRELDAKLGPLPTGLLAVGHDMPPKKQPVAPYRHQGAINHLGWDIPTRWCVDANGDLFKDYAHGWDPSPTTVEVLLHEASDDKSAEAEIRRVLGLASEAPSVADQLAALQLALEQLELKWHADVQDGVTGKKTLERCINELNACRLGVKL
jgi:hypothetical protein